jgi:DNA invertase Pin-like site-specific DNA recombinase
MSIIRAYVRSSRPPKGKTREERDTALGIASQRRDIAERFPTAVFYEDRFKSGRSPRRPGLRTLLDEVGAGDLIVVSRIDRLARDARLMVSIEYQVEVLREARIVSLAGEGFPIDGPPDPTQVFLRRVLAAQAELASAQCAASTRAALAVKKAAGIAATGTVAFGYRLGHERRLVEDDREQEVLSAIREFCRGRLEGASGAEVARHLNARGFLNRSGKPFERWQAQTIIRSMIRRELEEVSS